MGRQWPGSVVNAMRLLWVLVALMGIATLLTWLLEDDLVASWAEGNPGAREIVREGGIEALEASSLSPPAFVPVAVVMYIVLVSLVVVLRAFFREGYEWARMSLVGVGLVLALAAGLIAFRESPPTVFVVVCLVALLVDLVFVALLLHPDTTAFVRGAWLVHHDIEDRAA